MATEEAVLEEELEVTEEVDEVVDDDQVTEEEVELENEESVDESDEEGEDIVEISLGDESLTSEPEEEEQAPSWVKDLRKTHRETQRENRELRKKLEAVEQAPKEEPAKIAKKPTLEDFDYDSDKYEAAMGEWFDQKKQADEKKRAAEAEAKRQADEWQEKLDSYEKKKKELGVKDYEDAESVALENFDQTQQGIILQGSENAALAVYAIGKNSKRAKELAAIKDPVKFAFAVAKLETQLKVNKRKAKSRPEGKLGGTRSKSTGVDSTLERLEAEAAKTGNRTKIVAYKRKLRDKKK